MYVLKSGPMACETLGGVLLTEETDRQEKEQGGCSVEMWGRTGMRRSTSLKEVKTMNGGPLKEIAALMETSVQPVCSVCSVCIVYLQATQRGPLPLQSLNPCCYQFLPHSKKCISTNHSVWS